MMTPPTRLDEIPDRLRELRAAAGEPSYTEIARRVGALRADRGESDLVSRVTVYDCFKPGRKRFDMRLVAEIARVLLVDSGEADAFDAALQGLGRRSASAALVSVVEAIPAATGPFVGRSVELARLATGGAHWIHALAGTGTTWLALQSARSSLASGRVAGVVLVDLRGCHPTQHPAEPQAVVRATLRMLGERNPSSAEDAARERLRELLVEQHRLLILDDAASADQVAAIVDRPDGLDVIVTSRRTPTDPAFREMRLPAFSAAESLELLAARAGPDAAQRDPGAAEALFALDGHHPLAVGLAAAQVAERQNWTMAEHLERARARREALRLEEPVARSLDLSYRLLSAPAQRALRMMAHHPVEPLDTAALAVLLDADGSETGAIVDELTSHNLIARLDDGRVGMHELVRVFAADLAWEIDPASGMDAAAERLRREAADHAWSSRFARRFETSADPTADPEPFGVDA